MTNIDDFIKAVMEESGLSGMPETFLSEYSEKLKEEAQKRLGIIAMDSLSGEQVDEFNLLVESGKSEDDLNSYLSINIEDFELKMTEALKGFAEEVIESAKKLNIK